MALQARLSYCERVFFELAVLSLAVTVSLNRVSLTSQTDFAIDDRYNGLGTRIRSTSPGPSPL